MSALYMDSSCLASKPLADIRRVCIFGFLLEMLSPNPTCMRTLISLWVDGLEGLKAEQNLSRWIALSDFGLLTELGDSFYT